ncbi:unnamed protein product [Clonostachys rhizophaga]|uniref:Myosin class II heavy chain n=1 Tax=Clonostachys rhizophaga TaxID=160324 RepID=A0A9N9YB45_9HYPO|nr:unnamed protein product [Clonostachys rhizophaga]
MFEQLAMPIIPTKRRNGSWSVLGSYRLHPAANAPVDVEDRPLTVKVRIVNGHRSSDHVLGAHRTLVTTSPPKSSTPAPGAYSAQNESAVDSKTQPQSPRSPALSDASTADGSDGLESSPALPPLQAPPLPPRTQNLLRSPSAGTDEDNQFGTASWGSPYPRTDRNLRRRSFSSDASDEFPVHNLAIDTPFLRPPPELASLSGENSQPGISAAAAVLANRVRRQVRGLTEDWIRTHTSGDLENVEPRHWFSDGSGSEHSSLSGSEAGWLGESDLRTPKASKGKNSAHPVRPFHPRGRSSVETLKPADTNTPRGSKQLIKMATADNQPGSPGGRSATETPVTDDAAPMTPTKTKPALNGEAKFSTPTKITQKPLPKEPAMTPRIKKKVPWKGKNIMVLLPRDEERGLPGKPPKPLRQEETEKMFASWRELGYGVDGFDLMVDDYQPTGSHNAQSRGAWPDHDDVVEERSERHYQVTLPDLNAWKNYVDELQEAKLRALGVSFGDDEPAAPSPLESAVPSRQASAQYPPLPFSPPLPTSSASSNHAPMGFPFPGQFNSATQSPNIPQGASPVPFVPGKFNPRASISFSGNNSPFQMPQSPLAWPGLQNVGRADSPSFANMNGMVPAQPPFDLEGLPPNSSPALNNLHQRQQSLQFPLVSRQSFQFPPPMRDFSRLQEVYEEEEELKSPSKTPEPLQDNNNPKAELGDEEYHLEEQLRNELEHEDYDPHAHSQQASTDHGMYAQDPAENFQVPAHFANQPEKPLTLHHPRPHSRGHSLSHSLSQNFLVDQNQSDDNANSVNKPSAPLHDIIETHKGEERWEIETNPSNLGTPVQDFDFAGPFAQHDRNVSTGSNPWNDYSSSASNPRRASHASKPSLSKLNVKAPEFKFNPASSFTPGQSTFTPGQSTFTPGQSVFNPGQNSFTPAQSTFAPAQSTFNPGQSTFNPGQSTFNPGQSSFTPGQFNFGGQSFQPAIFQANVGGSVAGSVSLDSLPPLDNAEEVHIEEQASFAPEQSDFNFSTSGPKFRPDAPSFMPFSPAPTVGLGLGNKHAARESIFGNIHIEPEVAKPVQKSKAIPILRPTSSRASDRAAGDPGSAHEDSHKDTSDNRDRGPDDFRAKRAKSAMPDGDDVPLFAEQPKDLTPSVTEEAQEPPKEPRTSIEEEHHLPADTSMSSAVMSDNIDTKATTAAPSESSQVEVESNLWSPFEFDSRFDAKNFSEARPLGDEEPVQPSGHRKSLSATAPSFMPGAMFGQEEETPRPETPEQPDVEIIVAKRDTEQPRASSPQKRKASSKGLGLGSSRFASPPPKPKGLASSRYASAASVVEPENSLPTPTVEKKEVLESVEHEEAVIPATEHGQLSFEDIDAVMEQLENDPSLGVNKSIETASFQSSPAKPAPLADVNNSSALKLEPPSDHFVLDTKSSGTPTFQPTLGDVPLLPTTEMDDPFVDPQPDALEQAGGQIVIDDTPAVSDWEAAFSADEHDKLDSRAQFFDGRVNEVVGNLLASRLEPLENILFSIQDAIALKAGRPSSSRRDLRSVSAEKQQSDADDEDEEPTVRRSLSPRRDRRLDQIRAAVMEGIATQQRMQPLSSVPEQPEPESQLFEAVADIKRQLEIRQKADFDAEHLQAIVEHAVKSQMPVTVEPDQSSLDRNAELEAKVAQLEQELRAGRYEMDKEIEARRAAEDVSADLNRQLKAAETRVEVEIINRSVYDQRVADLEEKLRYQENQSEEQIQNRRAAEDRLAEVQRLLRIASEEEDRLREVNDEKEQRIKSMEQANAKSSMKMALLEAAQNNATQSQSEMTNKLNVLEADLRNVRLDNDHWRAEAERNDELAHRRAGELAHIQEEHKHLQKTLYTLSTQLEENERLRDSWRSKFNSLQDDMRKAAREIAEENARHIKKDQVMHARQEVLDARLQAEAKTRERLELEMDRLQDNERAGMRAANECKRLEELLAQLRTENHRLQQRASEAEREFEEARESGLSEVKRTRMAMQTEIDAANHQVNVVREELEEQYSKLRAELDSFKLDADTVKARNEMLLEDAEATKAMEIEQLKQKHQNELEDLEARYEQQRNARDEESSKTEENLLERLSFSSTKIDHLQDRINHLEEKLEVSKEAAAAAVAAAKSAAAAESKAPAQTQSRSQPDKSDLPEKISPQALRESIMVLQEQLQAREQRIEELEQTVAKSDPEAEVKISKRDDEISWLRELLAVRHGDLQDIITALSGNNFDHERVKDAAIRLKANLQMEEQERERAMSGASALSLPSIAQSITASPRVAQTIGPIAAAWGNWRKGSTSSFAGFTARPGLSAGSRNGTPSRAQQVSRNSQPNGLMTPPASNVRQMPVLETKPQPTAFSSTGRRYPSHGNPSRARNVSDTSRQAEDMSSSEVVMPHPAEEEEEQPMTPTMMRSTHYDSDAQPADYYDDEFFEDN